MNRRLRNSNKKRGHDEDNSNQNKRKKLQVPEEADTMTNFTDVNDDCLEHIFKHLKLQDLINVADTCKQFQASAQTVFAAKYRGKVIRLDPDGSIRMPSIILNEKTVKISDLTSCLKVLRHFVVKISKLDIHYGRVSKDEKSELIRYMNEYCANSLVDLKIEESPKGVATNWIKIFENVESITIWRSNLRNLSTWFPNLRRMVLKDSTQCIKYKFPHLEELEIIHRYALRRASITAMLRLNQQLKILRLFGDDCDMKLIESLSAYIQSVTLLDINCFGKFFNLEGNSIHLKSVNEFHINLTRFDLFPKIPFTFDQLETVKLTVKQFDLNENVEKFIRENPSLKKLTVHAYGYTLNEVWVQKIKSDLAEISSSLTAEFVGFSVPRIQYFICIPRMQLTMEKRT